MKIEFINSATEFSKSKGFQKIDLNNLKRTVAFVGKNGSGKTRLIQCIEDFIVNEATIFDYIEGSIVDLPDSINEEIRKISPLRRFFDREKMESPIKLDIKQNKQYSINVEATVQAAARANNITPMNLHQVVYAVDTEIRSIVRKYIRKINAKDVERIKMSLASGYENLRNSGSHNNIAQADFTNVVKGIQNISNEFDTVANGAMTFFLTLPHILTSVHYRNFGAQDKSDESQEFKYYYLLKNIFNSLFGKNLDFTTEVDDSKEISTALGYQPFYFGTWKLDGHPFHYTELSDGEQTLFIYSMILFLIGSNPNVSLRECILIIDEPELHLHPAKEIDLVTGLEDIVGEKGQLIIATHSLNLIAQLEFDQVLLVRDSQIFYPGSKTSYGLISDLLDIEDRISRLSQYLGGISEWTFANFISQCLNDPDVITSSGEEDPQLLTLKEILERAKENNISVLDFGAGKGRLYKSLKEEVEFMDNISYHVLEPNTDFHPYLRNLGLTSIISKAESLPKSKYDIVLICNVLHEVGIEYWEELFKNLSYALKENGIVLLIEARRLSKGENIENHGFLVLSEREVAVLCSQDAVADVSVKGFTEKIMSVALTMSDIKNINYETIVKALKELESNTLATIKIIRQESTSITDRRMLAKAGLELGFQTQLNVNSRLALDYLNAIPF